MAAPRTINALFEQVASSRSRMAVYRMLITHMRTCYKKTDAGPAELRVARDDGAIVTERHIEQAIIEMEERVQVLESEIDEIQEMIIEPDEPEPAPAEPVLPEPKEESEDEADSQSED